MNKLTGNGRPTVYTHGQLGQYYEDLTTGDIYECRQSSKYSKLHGAPVGGYIWELRASGEDRAEHSEFFGGGDGGSGGGNGDSAELNLLKTVGAIGSVEEECILEETSITMTLGTGLYYNSTQFTLAESLVTGEYYVVVLDGTRYMIAAKQNDNISSYIGDDNKSVNGDYPFVVFNNCLWTKSGGVHTLAVYKFSKFRMDESFTSLKSNMVIFSCSASSFTDMSVSENYDVLINGRSDLSRSDAWNLINDTNSTEYPTMMPVAFVDAESVRYIPIRMYFNLGVIMDFIGCEYGSGNELVYLRLKYSTAGKISVLNKFNIALTSG